jgi:hypothetical protein
MPELSEYWLSKYNKRIGVIRRKTRISVMEAEGRQYFQNK